MVLLYTTQLQLHPERARGGCTTVGGRADHDAGAWRNRPRSRDQLQSVLRSEPHSLAAAAALCPGAARSMTIGAFVGENVGPMVVALITSVPSLAWPLAPGQISAPC